MPVPNGARVAGQSWMLNPAESATLHRPRGEARASRMLIGAIELYAFSKAEQPVSGS
jgi:hypothetical protein